MASLTCLNNVNIPCTCFDVFLIGLPSWQMLEKYVPAWPTRVKKPQCTDGFEHDDAKMARTTPIAGRQHDMMVPAGITPAFEVIEPELAFQFLVLLLDRPALMGQARERPERRRLGKGDEVEREPRLRAPFLFAQQPEPSRRSAPMTLIRGGEERDLAAIVAMGQVRANSFRFHLDRDVDFVQYAVTKIRLLAGLSQAGARQLHFFIVEEGIAVTIVSAKPPTDVLMVRDCDLPVQGGIRNAHPSQRAARRMPYAPPGSANRSRSDLVMTETRFRQAFLLLLVTAISAAFVAMIRVFLLTILLAAIFAGLSYPVYQGVLGWLRGRKALAAIATLVLLLALVMAPLLAVLGAGANEALRVTETIRPRLQQLVDQPGEFDSRLRALPGYHRIEPYRAQILTKAGELVGSTSAFLFAALSATTRATARLHLSLLCPALHDVFLPDRRSGPAPGRSRVPAAHRGRQATHGGEVRVGHPRDAQGHDPDRRGSGPPWRAGVLGSGS